MRRNFRNRKIASVPVKGPAFSDPKGTSRPSAEGKVSGEGEAGQPLGSRGRGPPRIFAYFLFVKKVWPAAASGREKTRCNESKYRTGTAEQRKRQFLAGKLEGSSSAAQLYHGSGGTPRGAVAAPRSNHKFPGYRPRKFTVCFAPLLPAFLDHQAFRALRSAAKALPLETAIF